MQPKLKTLGDTRTVYKILARIDAIAPRWLLFSNGFYLQLSDFLGSTHLIASGVNFLILSAK